ncbi:hypothetical protein M0R45_002049 [Rubus argutus]|uniref:Uncharacterized protein n=1 Tax=Rubus argutus TaxID=59490 RepID=A0AAW1VKL5_RUBAR
MITCDLLQGTQVHVETIDRSPPKPASAPRCAPSSALVVSYHARLQLMCIGLIITIVACATKSTFSPVMRTSHMIYLNTLKRSITS